MRFLLLGILLSLTSIQAVELSKASDEEILTELSRRLAVGGNSNGKAVVIYACNTYGDLIITIAGPAGTEEKSYRDLGVPRCEAQIAILRKYKAEVKGTVMAAVCNSYGDLLKIPMYGSGKFGTETGNGTSGYDACMVQAKIINGAS